MAFLRLLFFASLALVLLKFDTLRLTPFAEAKGTLGSRAYSVDLASTLALRGRGAAVIDARERDLFERGHLPGAIHLSFVRRETDLETIMPVLAKATAVVVYCGGRECETSQLLAAFISSRGVPNVAFYRGGYSEWTSSGLPVEVSSPVRPL